MHFWASIEHSLEYKYQKNIPNEIKQRLIQASIASSRLDLEMSEIKKAVDELDRLENTQSNSQIDTLESEITVNTLKRW